MIGIRVQLPRPPRRPNSTLLSDRGYRGFRGAPRFRRLAWLLILVLVTGISSPGFASAVPCDATLVAVTHHHADGSVHSPVDRAGHDGAGAIADRNSGKIPHCPGCMHDAACAGACLGVAVLAATAERMMPASAAVWNSAASNVLLGIAPADAIDPPRTVLYS